MYARPLSRGFSGFGLGDTATIQAQITAAANQYGVPPSLALAVAQQESGFQQTGAGGSTLKSSAGALGVMQLMPATAAGLGVDPTDQQQNINGGVQLLGQLLTQFNGNVPDALAAYNSGAGNVIKYGGVPPFAETQNYVSSIMANYQASGGSTAVSSSSSDGSDSFDSGSTFDLSSITSALPGSDATVDLGGLVLSGSDLWLLGAAVVGVLVVSSML